MSTKKSKYGEKTMKCEKCGKKIEYNQYRVYGPKALIFCFGCYKKAIDENLAEIKGKREARKIKRGRRKKTEKSPESYNPFPGE